MQITEIFKSIQGESTYAGLPCIMIRLTGCNLRCAWCDTEYSFYGGEKMALDEVIQRVYGFGGKLVEITGGEPLLQKEVYVSHGPPAWPKTIGSCLKPAASGQSTKVPREVVKVVDVKCPDSGEANTFAMSKTSPHWRRTTRSSLS